MANLTLQIRLLSDTTFGRGDGLAGVVDSEVEHDATTGLPIIKGRTLKGLLVEECANILYALQQFNPSVFSLMEEAAVRLFGVPGSDLQGQSVLHIGTASLPAEFVAAVTRQTRTNGLDPQAVLESLTTIRYQTAVDASYDIPLENTLRAVRVIIRDTVFTAPVVVQGKLTEQEKTLFVACASALSRAGMSRNRGRGRIKTEVLGLKTTEHLTHFEKLLHGGDA